MKVGSAINHLTDIRYQSKGGWRRSAHLEYSRNHASIMNLSVSLFFLIGSRNPFAEWFGIGKMSFTIFQQYEAFKCKIEECKEDLSKSFSPRAQSKDT
jgi:hypothetical protein